MSVKNLLKLVGIPHEEIFEGYVISLRDFFINYSSFRGCDYEVIVKENKVIIYEI